MIWLLYALSAATGFIVPVLLYKPLDVDAIVDAEYQRIADLS